MMDLGYSFGYAARKEALEQLEKQPEPIKKTWYVCGSKKPDIFNKMQSIVLHYAHEHPRYFTKTYKNGQVYQALSVLLTFEEQEAVRKDISWIGIPESCRMV